MAKKDWKKQGTNYWSKGAMWLQLRNMGYGKKPFNVVIGNKGDERERFFTTNAEAMTFLNNYMVKH